MTVETDLLHQARYAIRALRELCDQKAKCGIEVRELQAYKNALSVEHLISIFEPIRDRAVVRPGHRVDETASV